MSLNPDQLNAALDAAFPGRNWAGYCEANRFQGTRLSNGLANMQSFDSAKVALANSRIETHDVRNVPAGWVGWWDKTQWGHDMLSFGNDIFFGATTLGDTIKDYGGGLKLLHGSSYPAPFLGAARNVGSNPQAQLTPYSDAGPVPAPGGWAFNPPVQPVQASIQKGLKNRGRYSGPIDGVWGINSIKGIQTTIRNVGYTGPIDGIPGERTCHFVQVYAQKFGGYKGPIDSILGPNSWAGFDYGLNHD